MSKPAGWLSGFWDDYIAPEAAEEGATQVGRPVGGTIGASVGGPGGAILGSAAGSLAEDAVYDPSKALLTEGPGGVADWAVDDVLHPSYRFTREKGGDAWDWITDKTSAVTDPIESGVDYLAGMPGAAWDTITGATEKTADLAGHDRGQGIIGGFTDAIGDAFSGTADAFGNVYDAAGDRIGDVQEHVVEPTWDAAKGIGGRTADVAGGFRDALADTFTGIPDALGNVWDSSGEIAGNVGDWAGDTGRAAWDTVTGATGKVADAADHIRGQEVTGRFGDAIGDAFSGTTDAFGNLYDNAGNVLGNAVDWLGGAGASTWDTITGATGKVADAADHARGQGITDRFGEAIGDAFSGTTDAFGNIYDGAGNVVGNAGSWLAGRGQDIGEGVDAGTGWVGDRLDTFGDAFAGENEGMPNWLGPALLMGGAGALGGIPAALGAGGLGLLMSRSNPQSQGSGGSGDMISADELQEKIGVPGGGELTADRSGGAPAPEGEQAPEGIAPEDLPEWLKSQQAIQGDMEMPQRESPEIVERPPGLMERAGGAVRDEVAEEMSRYDTSMPELSPEWLQGQARAWGDEAKGHLGNLSNGIIPRMMEQTQGEEEGVYTPAFSGATYQPSMGQTPGMALEEIYRQPSGVPIQGSELLAGIEPPGLGSLPEDVERLREQLGEDPRMSPTRDFSAGALAGMQEEQGAGRLGQVLGGMGSGVAARRDAIEGVGDQQDIERMLQQIEASQMLMEGQQGTYEQELQHKALEQQLDEARRKALTPEFEEADGRMFISQLTPEGDSVISTFGAPTGGAGATWDNYSEDEQDYIAEIFPSARNNPMDRDRASMAYMVGRGDIPMQRFSEPAQQALLNATGQGLYNRGWTEEEVKNYIEEDMLPKERDREDVREDIVFARAQAAGNLLETVAPPGEEEQGGVREFQNELTELAGPQHSGPGTYGRWLQGKQTDMATDLVSELRQEAPRDYNVSAKADGDKDWTQAEKDDTPGIEILDRPKGSEIPPTVPHSPIEPEVASGVWEKAVETGEPQTIETDDGEVTIHPELGPYGPLVGGVAGQARALQGTLSRVQPAGGWAERFRQLTSRRENGQKGGQKQVEGRKQDRLEGPPDRKMLEDGPGGDLGMPFPTGSRVPRGGPGGRSGSGGAATTPEEAIMPEAPSRVKDATSAHALSENLRKLRRGGAAAAASGKAKSEAEDDPLQRYMDQLESGGGSPEEQYSRHLDRDRAERTAEPLSDKEMEDLISTIAEDSGFGGMSNSYITNMAMNIPNWSEDRKRQMIDRVADMGWGEEEIMGILSRHGVDIPTIEASLRERGVSSGTINHAKKKLGLDSRQVDQEAMMEETLER